MHVPMLNLNVFSCEYMTVADTEQKKQGNLQKFWLHVAKTTSVWFQFPFKRFFNYSGAKEIRRMFHGSVMCIMIKKREF